MKTKYILPKNDKNYFFTIIKNFIYTKEFLKLKKFNHHGNISTYSHTIKVAYRCYCFAVKMNIKINRYELIVAALLHDLYFYDWHDKNNGVHLHGLFHPRKAIINATNIYNISKRIKRHMAHHMFPLTLIPPTTKEGWLICIFDKAAAISDYRAIKLRNKALNNMV